MVSQLGKMLPFYHKGCGGQITQAAHPELPMTALGVPLKYFCTGCKKFVETNGVTEDYEESKKPWVLPAPAKEEVAQDVSEDKAFEEPQPTPVVAKPQKAKEK